jgi:hypothetical protein
MAPVPESVTSLAATGAAGSRATPLQTRSGLADEVRAEIRKLAQSLYAHVRLTHGNLAESAAFEETIFAACLERGYTERAYEFTPVDPSAAEGRLVLRLGAYAIEADGTPATLEDIAREHARIIRVVRDSRAARSLREAARLLD